jgi:hypothetical protein
MSYLRCILLSLLAVFSISLYSQEIESDHVLRLRVSRKGQAEVTIAYKNKSSFDNLTRNISVLSVRNGIIRASLSPLTVDWFLSQSYDYRLEPEQETKGIIVASGINRAMEWDNYPTYSQYDSIMKRFTEVYPTLCRLDTIGKSILGKYVFALKISDNANADEDEPEVFYSSTIHGNETAGFILMLRLSEYLLKNYDTNSRVRRLVDDLEIWINPLANPDGMYGTGNIMTSPTRYNANGYDLNRNFPDPVTPGTVKQPETLDMMKFLRQHRFVLSANFHSGVEVINYPWDRWLSRYHADDEWFHGISRAYADTVHKYSSPSYMNEFENGVVRGSEWYIIYGGRQDYITWELQGREVTIEVDESYVTPALQLPVIWDYNYRSLLGYLENALYGIHAKVTDADTGEPLPARIFINGHDTDSSHVYSDTLTGRFLRLLYPGTYDLSITARGYRDTVVSSVTVYPFQRTDLIIEMKSGTNNIGNVIHGKPILYPNPALDEIKVLMPDEITGTVNLKIYDTAGMLMTDYDIQVSRGAPVIIQMRSLSRGMYYIIFRDQKTGLSFREKIIITK